MKNIDLLKNFLLTVAAVGMAYGSAVLGCILATL